MDGLILRTVGVRGRTRKSTLINLAKQINGKILVTDAHDCSTRNETILPKSITS